MKKSQMSGIFFSIFIATAIGACDVGVESRPDPQTTAGPVLRLKGSFEDLRRIGVVEQRDPRSDAANDPPGLVGLRQLAPLQALAMRLSGDRFWLTQEVVDALAERSIALDELFAETKGFVQIGGRPYRLYLEKVGPAWQRFESSRDPYLLYISQEVFDGFGADSVLGYLDGDEISLTSTEIEAMPALALTLASPTQDPPPPSDLIHQLQDPIRLGPARRFVRQPPQTQLVAATCAPEVAPAYCSTGGVPVCASGYSPYFVLSSLLIKVDHEGFLKGNPEIELFPLRLDSVSPSGGIGEATTDWLFSGRSVSDLAGRSRYLPNVNSTNVWYTIPGGLAIFPSDAGMEWSATLVEQDDEAGRLKVSPTKINVTKLYKRVASIINDVRQMQYFHLIKSVFRLIFDIIKIFQDGDDIYQEALGISNELFCNDGVGQAFPRIFSFMSQEWEMQGYFACINPSCEVVEPPSPPNGNCFRLTRGFVDCQ